MLYFLKATKLKELLDEVHVQAALWKRKTIEIVLFVVLDENNIKNLEKFSKLLTLQYEALL